MEERGREREREFRTGEQATEPGGYVCETGTCDLEAGEEFPTCPETGRETTWRRAQ